MKKRYIVKVADINKPGRRMGNKKKVKSFQELDAHIFELDDAELEDLKLAPEDFEYIEEDGQGQGLATTNDPGLANQWYLPKVNVINAWDIVNSDPTLKIAILDTGMDFNHPDLPATAIKGRDYVNSDNEPIDDHGHGTAVAGIIAAKGNNSIGIAGIAMNCQLIIYKVLDSSNWGYYSNWAAAIRAAADAGAKIISMSMGGATSSATLQSAVDYAWSKGAIVVVAAGNGGSDAPSYPAACNNALAISSIESNDSFSGWSSWGSFVDLCCYGGGIYTTHIGGGYASWTGTSFSCPMVAGIIALIWSAKRSLTNVQIIDYLKKNCVNLGDPLKFGVGKPDAYKTINDILGTVTPPPNDTMFSDASIEAIGLNEFRRRWPAYKGRGINLLQVEYEAEGWSAPNALYLPSGVTPKIGTHATEVAKVVRLFTPEITLYNSHINFFENSLRNSSGSGTVSNPSWNPTPAVWNVENHSYTYSYAFVEKDLAKAQDTRIIRDKVISYAACGNSPTEVRYVWNGSYYVRMVGGDATPSGTYAIWSGGTQTYPDVKVPTYWSSIASPAAAASAALLLEAHPTKKDYIVKAIESTAVSGYMRIDKAMEYLIALGTGVAETWSPFVVVEVDWYVKYDWSPDPANYYKNEDVFQTRTLERRLKTGEISNLGNTRNVQIVYEQKTETRTVKGTKAPGGKKSITLGGGVSFNAEDIG